MKEPIETAELLAFVKAVDAGSLSGAAAKLGAPRATITRRLSQLERRLGTRLLRRTTRSLTLTDAGEALYLHAQIALDALQSAELSVRRKDDTIRGDLRVSVPLMITRGLHLMLCDFAKRYPELRVHIHTSNEFVDLQRGGFDVAIRASSELEPGLVARTLSRQTIIAVCSPKYIEARGEPTTLRDLKRHACLMGLTHGDKQTHWHTKNHGKIYVEGSFFASDIILLTEAAVSGLGIAMIPSVLARPFLESGALVRVLPNSLEATAQLAVVYHEREFIPPQVKAFVDTVIEWAPRELGDTLTEQCREATKGRAK